jgi:hypothetical protein
MKTQYEMLKLNTKYSISAFNAQGSRGFYSSCTGRSSENLWSSSGGAQEKNKDRVKLRKPSGLIGGL